MNYIKAILLVIPLFTVNLKAQDKMELFPAELNIQPFTANFLEPKLGFILKINNNELRLDIGNTIDILQYQLDESTSLSFGADMFTYTFLRGETDFHFPVDAVDYLFGFNGSWKKQIGDDSYGIRVRLSHISAHFVDGHFDGKNGVWLDNRPPRVYSREFLELIPFYSWNSLRVYGGFTYIFHVDPINLGKDIYHLGFDYFSENILGDNLHFFAGYDLRIVNIYDYHGNNTLNLGIKLGKVHGRGISIYYKYYSGKNIHGEYFDYNEKHSALGINLDL